MVRGILVTCLTGLVGALIVASSLSAQDAPTKTIKLPDGTPIHLYLMDDLSSKKSKSGDVVRFKVREALKVGGVEVIAADSPVAGHLVMVGHRKLGGHSGRLSLSIDSAIAVSGAKIPLRGEATAKGGSRGATTWESAAWFGPDAEIRKGTMLNAYVDGDQAVNLDSH